MPHQRYWGEAVQYYDQSLQASSQHNEEYFYAFYKFIKVVQKHQLILRQ